MEEGPCAYRAPASLSSRPEAANLFEGQILLATKKVPDGSPEKLSRMGVQAGSSLLVHQRHDLRMQVPQKLAGENETLPLLRSAVGLALAFAFR